MSTLNFRGARAIISAMDELLSRVRRYARRYGLWQANEIIVVGVSGGPDSLCLLHLLRRLAPERRLWLHVAHLNHGLRGVASDADAAYVAEVAECWGLPCTLGRADVAALAEAGRLSLEEAARLARYRFLAATARTGGARTIAVGHNADDQAETVLMHFLRGSGIAGLRGMAPRATLADYRLFPDGETETQGHGDTASPGLNLNLNLNLNLVRPLLATSRAEIEAYCAAHNLAPRYDRSNEDTTFFRNRLRHELLPALEAYNPAIRAVLAHTAEVLAGDHAVLRGALDATWAQVALSGEDILRPPARRDAMQPGPELPAVMLSASPPPGTLQQAASEASVCHDPYRGQGRLGYQPGLQADFQGSQERDERGADGVLFDLAAWRALPLGLQRATIREAIHRLRRSLRNITWEHVARAVWLAREGGTGQAATLAAGLELQIGYDTLRIAAAGAAWQVDVPQVRQTWPLAAPGATEVEDGWQVHVTRLRRAELPADFAANSDPWIAYLDAGAVGEALILRPRQPGDRFQPQGLGGHSAALNEFMINAKITRSARAGWPLLIGQGGIAWVCGLRLDQRAAVRPESAAIWYVRFARS